MWMKYRSIKENLADRLKIKFPDIQDLLNKFSQVTVTKKADGSPVTELDLALSLLIESFAKEHYSDHCFYSEENFSQMSFPLLALDPLDGTREYINGSPEWAMSIGLFPDSSFKGEGWVYNPVRKEVFSQGTAQFLDKELYRGEVSRSEWENGLFKNLHSQKFQVTPVGSIAYKLGRLSKGECDFVVSLRPKNIWDIAGGSLLCQEAGIKFYSKGREVTEVQALYDAPLLWCSPSIKNELFELFPPTGK
jgi:myo-inositol-1(or 4)-monophosphatase